MIPTRLKAKIPHSLSYPIGAKTISDALAGVPQFDSLMIQFRWRRHGLGKRYSWRPGSGKSFPVVSVSYSNFRPGRFFPEDMIERYFGAKWEIFVEAVPRELSAKVRAKLVDEALPRVRKWLDESPLAAVREGRHDLTFFYDDWHTTRSV